MGRKREFDETSALRAAMSVFWEKGYEKASVQDLLDAMDIRRKSMYDTFGDKHALYMETLKLYIRNMNDRIHEILKRDCPAKDRIHDILLLLLKNGDRYTGCLLVNMTVEQGLNDEQTKTVLDEEYRYLQSVFSALLEKGQKEGSVQNDIDIRRQALFLLNTWIGIRAFARTAPDKAVIEDIVGAAMKMI